MSKDIPLILLVTHVFFFFLQRPRIQVNGKIMEDGNTVHVEAVMNGGSV